MKSLFSTRWWAISLICSLVLGKVVNSAFYNCTRPGLAAITFDDGPGDPGTNEVLDVLKRVGVKASFFINGLFNYEGDLARYKRTISRIYNEGHQLGSHSWNHINLIPLNNSEILNELEHLAQLVRETVGVNMTVFRPPHGEFTLEMETLIQSNFGYTIAMWNVDTRDWDNPSLGVMAYKDFYNVTTSRDSSCIGLHHDPLPGSSSLTEETLTYLIQEVGLRVVTLAECFEIERHVPAPITALASGLRIHFLFTLLLLFLIFIAD